MASHSLCNLCPSAENNFFLLIPNEQASDQLASVISVREGLQGKQYNTSAGDQNLLLSN